MSHVPKKMFQSLSVLEQSLACHLRLLDPERLPHPLMLGLWPFFLALDDFVMKFLQSSNSSAIPELLVRLISEKCVFTFLTFLQRNA